MIDAFCEWGTRVLSKESLQLSPEECDRVYRIATNPEDFRTQASEYSQLFRRHGIPLTIEHITQSASDACNLLIEYVGSKGRLLVESGKMHSSRGLLKPYGPWQEKTARVCSNIHTLDIPRYGHTDMASLLHQSVPGPKDVQALEVIRKNMRSKSVILCEIITNKVYNGCVTGYFIRELLNICNETHSMLVIDETLTAFRTGLLWSYEHVRDFIPHKVIFGKAFQVSGIATSGAHKSDNAITTPVHPVALFHADACLRRCVPLFPTAKGLTTHARKLVESRFENVQGIGLLFACAAPEPEHEAYFEMQFDDITCAQLDDTLRFMMPLDLQWDE